MMVLLILLRHAWKPTCTLLTEARARKSLAFYEQNSVKRNYDANKAQKKVFQKQN